MTHHEHISEAQRKILELERERQRIDEELKAWKQIRDAHESLAKTGKEQEKLAPLRIGFTEAIRVVLRNSPEGLAPTQIRDQLREYGISCGADKNFMSNIHAILRRSPDIEAIGTAGRKLYRVKPR